MIGRLRGELVSLDGSLALVEAAGVGYEVSIPDMVALQLPPVGSEVTFLIRQIFREDGVSLCGFVDPFQRRLFDLLLSVKGCGPKVALALLGQVGEEAVASAIVDQDARALTRATGVGTRLADRIVLELKDKMQEERLVRKAEQASGPSRKPRASDDLVDTLLTLGYRRHEAETAAVAAQDVPGELADRLKHALSLLKK
jgi:Holliday junction DNA helicase RuvA